MEIEKIIQGCKSGDRSCQEALVRQFAPRLLAVCRRYCKDFTLAEDVLQETFINVFKYIHTYSGSGSFEGWMRRIAVTKSIEMNQRFFKLPVYTGENEIQIEEVNIPDAYAMLGEEDLLKLIQCLPSNQYLVFNMYIIEGYSHQEIAQILTIAEGTSRALLSRARAALVEKLNVAKRSISLPIAHA